MTRRTLILTALLIAGVASVFALVPFIRPYWLAKYRGASADLRDACLIGAPLSRADLYYADLRGANLAFANLTHATLVGADLDGANLRGANLAETNASYADLPDANLRGANLRGASLSGADLPRANLEGADLEGAYLCTVGFTPVGASQIHLYQWGSVEHRAAQIRLVAPVLRYPIGAHVYSCHQQHGTGSRDQ